MQPILYEKLSYTGFFNKMCDEIKKAAACHTFSEADKIAANRWLCQVAKDAQADDLTRPSCRGTSGALSAVYQFRSKGDLDSVQASTAAMASVFRQPFLSSVNGPRGIIQLVRGNFSTPVMWPVPHHAIDEGGP